MFLMINTEVLLVNGVIVYFSSSSNNLLLRSHCMPLTVVDVDEQFNLTVLPN